MIVSDPDQGTKDCVGYGDGKEYPPLGLKPVINGEEILLQKVCRKIDPKHEQSYVSLTHRKIDSAGIIPKSNRILAELKCQLKCE